MAELLQNISKGNVNNLSPDDVFKFVSLLPTDEEVEKLYQRLEECCGVECFKDVLQRAGGAGQGAVNASFGGGGMSYIKSRKYKGVE